MPGLSISRRRGEAFWIRTSVGDVRVEVFGMGQGKVKFSIEAPAAMTILREELLGRSALSDAVQSMKGGVDGPGANGE